MLKKVLFISLFFYAVIAKSQGPIPVPRIDYYPSHSDRSAMVVDYKELNLSLISKSRYGNFPNTELLTDLSLIAFAPNIGFKHIWYKGNFYFSSQHSIYYPTPGLKFMQNTGFKDQVSKYYDIPNIFTFNNQLIGSYILNKEKVKCNSKIPDLILSLRMGIEFSAIGKGDIVPYLTYYFLYNRSYTYRESKKTLFAGLNLDGNIYHQFNFSINADYYKMDSDFAIESMGKAIWNINHTYAVAAGYKFNYLDCQFGTQYILTPILDLTVKFNNNKYLRRGLFKK
ncbi:MAG: hypothetical protein N4A49_06490 [Marinifilaceae bacterium]|jgi:hypothetical protein|nr:hypothetical protein [Marinifilaceae bacterium]